MATQRVTVLKIGGAGATRIIDAFGRFRSRQKKDRDPEALISSDHWTAACRRRMDALAQTLRTRGGEPPVVFFAEYVDMWSAPAGPGLILPVWERHAVQLYSGDYVLECYELPDRGRLQVDLTRALRRKAIRERDPQEDRWALVILQEALSAWQPLVKDAALVWLRQAVAPTVTDEQLALSLREVPKWLKAGKSLT